MNPVTHTLRSQMADWNDLSLELQEAAYFIWRDYGRDAAIAFCVGA